METPSQLYRRLAALPHAPCEMLFENEAIALAKAAENAIVVEIGAWKGASTAMLASTAQFVYSIDPHEGIADTTSGAAQQPTIESCRQTLLAAGVGHKVALIPSRSHDVTIPRPTEVSSVTFIDGSHLEEDVFEDLWSWAPPLGILIVDDLGYESVRRAFDRWKTQWPIKVTPIDLREWGIEDPIHNRLQHGAVSKCTFFRLG